jgi:hypothetical protein
VVSGRFSNVELAGRSMYKRIEMNWTRITRHRFCLALVASMLFCGLSSIEIPEFARLADDTSNDYTFIESTMTSASVSVDASSRSLVSAVQQNDDQLEYRSQYAISILFAHSPAEYLQLLCIHRT